MRLGGRLIEGRTSHWVTGTGRRHILLMAYIEMSDRMTLLLKCLSLSLPDEDMVLFRRTPEWIQARTWGWVMKSGELTGTGSRHAGEIPTGILPTVL